MKPVSVFFLFSLCLLACRQQPGSIINTTPAVVIDKQPGECPYLTRDARGNTVLSWIRLLNDSTTAFCYATSSDGRTFAEPAVIPGSGNIQPHGENLPKIVFKPSGEIIALWGAGNPNPRNKYSGLVYYTQSFDNGKTWTVAKPLVNDTASYDQRYYDVALLPNGEAGIIWLDNRKSTTKAGSALYYATTNGRNGFGDGKRICQPCCPCCRTSLYVDSKGGIHALFRGILQDSIRDMVHSVSTDNGQTFSEPKRISNDNWVLNACPHTGPAMTENMEGIHFTWYTGANGAGCRYTRSTDNGQHFVVQDSVNARGSHPQLTSLANGELLVVWDESRVEGNKVCKQIGLQKRSASGRNEGTTYLTPATGNASFPVIRATGANTSIVAYTNKQGDRNLVSYQVVELN